MLAGPAEFGQKLLVVIPKLHCPYALMKHTKRDRRHSSRRCEASEGVKYWHNLWRRARRFRVDLPHKKWCDYWHTHFDWESRGLRSRSEHRKHIRPLMHAFARAKNELKDHAQPSQIFACIYPSDPGSDGLYVHTPNPNSSFPTVFDKCRFTDACPPLLIGLVDMRLYQIGISTVENDVAYTILPR